MVQAKQICTIVSIERGWGKSYVIINRKWNSKWNLDLYLRDTTIPSDVDRFIVLLLYACGDNAIPGNSYLCFTPLNILNRATGSSLVELDSTRGRWTTPTVIQDD